MTDRSERKYRAVIAFEFTASSVRAAKYMVRDLTGVREIRATDGAYEGKHKTLELKRL